MVNIDFNMDNIQKCLCPGCPVQAKSECVQDKLSKMQSRSGGLPSTEDVPQVYCGTGKATCNDLDPNQSCQCPKCEVWKEYKLGEAEPDSYYCVRGDAR